MKKRQKREPVVFDVPDCVGTYLHEYPYGFDIKIVHDELNTCDICGIVNWSDKLTWRDDAVESYLNGHTVVFPKNVEAMCDVCFQLIEGAQDDMIDEIIHHDFPTDKTMHIVYNFQDVRQGANRPELSDEQCRDILHYVRKKFDMNVGITWENFEIAADYLFPKENSNAQ